MFVALPFLIFYASFSLLLGIYDARTGLLPDRFTCPLLWGGLLYHQICLPERLPDALWGAIACVIRKRGLDMATSSTLQP